MEARVGRNHPCPCGSGRKFKFCCLKAGGADHAGFEARPAAVVELSRRGEPGSPQFRFEAGSYAYPECFLPSIACLKLLPTGSWDYHFVLVLPHSIHMDEDAAIVEADADIARAFRAPTSDEQVALRLRDRGYVIVSNFHVAGEPRDLEGFRLPLEDDP